MVGNVKSRGYLFEQKYQRRHKVKEWESKTIKNYKSIVIDG